MCENKAKRMGGELFSTSFTSGFFMYGKWQVYVSCLRMDSNLCGLVQIWYIMQKGKTKMRGFMEVGGGSLDGLWGWCWFWGKLSDFWVWTNRVAGFDLRGRLLKPKEENMEFYFYLNEIETGLGRLRDILMYT